MTVIKSGSCNKSDITTVLLMKMMIIIIRYHAAEALAKRRAGEESSFEYLYAVPSMQCSQIALSSRT